MADVAHDLAFKVGLGGEDPSGDQVALDLGEPDFDLDCLPRVIAEIVEIRISKSKARGGRGSGPTTDEQRRNSEFWSETQFRRGA